jgi:hypothetical protein
MGAADLSDEEILRIWTKQAYSMGLIDEKIPVPRRKAAFGIPLSERRKIRARAELLGGPDPFMAYNSQLRVAAKRGIEWRFTFTAWWALWEPYWAQRGHQGHGLEMCRKGDTGPYSPDNVIIASGLENREMTRGRASKRKYKPGKGY